MAWNNYKDFKSWYKDHYGIDYVDGADFTKKEGMSDQEYAAGQELFKGYRAASSYDNLISDSKEYYNNQGNSLLQRYSTVGANLEENKRIAQQNASITYDKLRKYLPTELKAQGYGDHAATESSMLQADSNYMNAMGNIAAEHSKVMADVELEKNDTMSELEKYRRDELTKYSDAKDKALTDAADDALTAYNTKVKEIYETNDSNYSDIISPKLEDYKLLGEWEEAKKYLWSNRSKLNQDDFERERKIIQEKLDILSGKEYFEDYKGRLFKLGEPVVGNVEALNDKLEETGITNENLVNGYTVFAGEDWFAYYDGKWYYTQDDEEELPEEAKKAREKAREKAAEKAVQGMQRIS